MPFLEDFQPGTVQELPSTVGVQSQGNDPYEDLFQEHGSKYGVDPKLLRRVAQVESSLNPRAISPKGAQGMMQLMPGTAGDMGVSDPFDPGQNIEGGAKYLKQLIDSHGGNVSKALASYNWGPGNVAKGEEWPQEVKDYVSKVGVEGSNVRQEQGEESVELDWEGLGDTTPTLGDKAVALGGMVKDSFNESLQPTDPIGKLPLNLPTSDNKIVQSILDVGYGIPEAGAALSSGIASFIGGQVGGGAVAPFQEGGFDERLSKAFDVAEKANKMGMYQPKTATGQLLLKPIEVAFGTLLGTVDKVARATAPEGLDEEGLEKRSKAWQFIANSVVLVAPLALKGGKSGAKAIMDKTRRDVEKVKEDIINDPTVPSDIKEEVANAPIDAIADQVNITKAGERVDKAGVPTAKFEGNSDIVRGLLIEAELREGRSKASLKKAAKIIAELDEDAGVVDFKDVKGINPKGSTGRIIADIIKKREDAKAEVLVDENPMPTWEEPKVEEPLVDAPPITPPIVERRADSARRKAVAEMSPEEMQLELLTDPLTGLGNKRKFEEAEAAAPKLKLFFDVDSLKFVNDSFGHTAGDSLLAGVGEALNRTTDEAYHISGDEFIIRASSEAEAKTLADNVNKILEESTIEYVKDGEVYTLTPGVSYGIGETVAKADARMLEHKAEREQQGLRAGRGEQPAGLVKNSSARRDVPSEIETSSGGEGVVARDLEDFRPSMEPSIEETVIPEFDTTALAKGEGYVFPSKRNFTSIEEAQADVTRRGGEFEVVKIGERYRVGKYAEREFTKYESLQDVEKDFEVGSEITRQRALEDIAGDGFDTVQVGDKYYRVVEKAPMESSVREAYEKSLEVEKKPESEVEDILTDGVTAEDWKVFEEITRGVDLEHAKREATLQGELELAKANKVEGEGVGSQGLAEAFAKYRESFVEKINVEPPKTKTIKRKKKVTKEELPVVNEDFATFKTKAEAEAFRNDRGIDREIIEDPLTGEFMIEPDLGIDLKDFGDDLYSEGVEEYGSRSEELSSDDYTDYGDRDSSSARDLWDIMNNEEGSIVPLGPIGMLAEVGVEASKMFYSKAMRALDKYTSDKPINAGDILRGIVNSGVGKHEINAAKLNEFFESRIGTRIRPGDVRDYIKSSMVDVTEVSLDGKSTFDPLLPKIEESIEFLGDNSIIVQMYKDGYMDVAGFLGLVDRQRGLPYKNYDIYIKNPAPVYKKYAKEPGDVISNYTETLLTADNMGTDGPSWKDGHSGYSDIDNPIVRIIHDKITLRDGGTAMRILEMQVPLMNEGWKDQLGSTYREVPGNDALRAVNERIAVHPYREELTKDVIGKVLKEDVINPYNGSLLGKKGEVLDYDMYLNIAVEGIDLVPTRETKLEKVGMETFSKFRTGEFTKMPDYLQKNAYDIGVKWAIAKAKKDGVKSIILTKSDRLIQKYDRKKDSEGIKRLYDETLIKKFEAYNDKKSGEIDAPDKTMGNAKYSEFPINEKTPSIFSLLGNQRGSVDLTPLRSTVDQIENLMKLAKKAKQPIEQFLQGMGVGPDGISTFIKNVGMLNGYKKELRDKDSTGSYVFNPEDPTLPQTIKRNKAGQVVHSMPAIPVALANDVLAMEKKPWGRYIEHVDPKTGRVSNEHVTNTFDRFMQATETKINAFTGPLRPIYYNWREAKAGAKREKAEVKELVDELKSRISPDRMRDFAIACYADMKSVKEAFDKMGITEIPKLTTEEIKVKNELINYTVNFRKRANYVRTHTGQKAIPKLLDVNGQENYLPLFRDLNVLKQLGITEGMVITDSKKIGQLSKTFNGMFNPHALKRNVSDIPIELDPFKAIEKYSNHGLDEIYISPIAALAKELAYAKLPRLDGKGKTSLADVNPAVSGMLSRWSDSIVGKDPIATALANQHPLLARGLKAINKNLVIATIGGSLRTIFVQPSSYIIAVPTLLDLRSTAYGLWRLGTERPFSREATVARRQSDVLSIREPELAYAEMAEYIQDGLFKGVREYASEKSMMPMKAMDGLVAEASWNAGYHFATKRLKLKGKDAVRFADDVVEKTQGMGIKGAVSDIQSSMATKWLTLLQTFGIADFNFIIRDVLGIKNSDVSHKKSLIRAMKYTMGTILAGQLYKAMGYENVVPDPIGEYKKAIEDGASIPRAIASAASELLEKVPIIGGSAKYGSNLGGVVGEWGDLIPEASIKLAASLDWDSLTPRERHKNLMLITKAVGYSLGIPATNQIIKSVNASYNGGNPYEVIMGVYVEASKGGKSGGIPSL